MSFLDNINPFRKKEEFGFPPLDQPVQELGQPNLDQGHNFDSGNFAADPHQAPMDDHRMTMPLGDNVRQGRINGMYGDDSHDTHESHPLTKEHLTLEKDLELVNSKLDYLKASLDAINQRLVNIEHLTKEEIERKKW